MGKIIVVTNQKGGVGKTSTCAALAGIFRSRNKKVLAIDMDPQGNLSFSLGAEDEGFTIHDALNGKCRIREAVKTTHICDVITSNIILSGTELELTTVRREYVLKDLLKQIKREYDFIIIDTPPALSVLTINAYTAADELIIPMTPEILSLQGLTQLKETIIAVKKYYNKHLLIRGILLTKFPPGKQLLATEVYEMVELVAQQFGTTVLPVKITNTVAVAEAPAHQETITQYSPMCRAAKDYIALAQNLYPEIF
ncbi:MAG: ParA family protein [Ruminococcus sp.]|jgi:chromosome partitioning protein|nr:ParA family protein [Ruminococcus sp.]